MSGISISAERFLLKVVDMYYKEEMLQDEIAKKLNVSRTTISRTLAKAKKEGYVKIIIDFPVENSIELEKELEQKYGLKEVIAVRSNTAEESDFFVAREAGLYLSRVIKNNTVLGIAWGRTIKKIIDSFESNRIGHQMKVKNVEIIPLLGTMVPDTAEANDLRASYSSLLSSKLAELVQGISYSFPAPMYVNDIETKERLLKEPQIYNLLQKAQKCEVGVFGIGTLTQHSSMVALDYAKRDTLLDLASRGGVGEIIGRVYDKNGDALRSEFDDRIIGLNLEAVKQIPTRVGVAFGENKIEAIRTAVATGIINVLITDSITSKSILQKS